MKYVCCIVDDGRPEYLAQVVKSVETNVHPLDEIYLINDTGDVEYAHMLESVYPQLDGFVHHSQRRGLAGAVQSAWSTAVEHGCDFYWHQEDDVPVIMPINLIELSTVLDRNPHLSQLMLMRPAFNDEEKNAGGVYRLTPDEFTEQTYGTWKYVEHERWYGFQPHLTTRAVLEYALDVADNFLELDVTAALKPAGYKFGYWGGLKDAPRCEHIGQVRSSGYRW